MTPRDKMELIDATLWTVVAFVIWAFGYAILKSLS